MTKPSRPHRPAPADRPEPAGRGRGPARWPLLLLALPAAVSTWTGWVGLGQLTGFGPVHPLPGIADQLVVNTAITLPIGVETYAAYALGAWLTPARLTPATRAFAKRSAIGSLALGMLGQIAYHLLVVAGVTAAPWQITTAVSCMPVLVLGMGAALGHMLARDLRTVQASGATVRTGQPPPVRGDTVRVDPNPVRPVGTGAHVQPVPSNPVPDAASRTPAAGHPARIRSVDRDTLINELAGDIEHAAAQGGTWAPDYAALIERTGYRRSWCEKAVREARTRASARIAAAANGQNQGLTSPPVPAH